MCPVRSVALPVTGQQFESIADSVHENHERVVFTKDGRDHVVVISSDELIALEETLDLLSDPAELAAVLQAQVEVERGEFFTESQMTELIEKRKGQSS